MTVKRIGKADYILGADVRKLKKDLKGADESVKKSGKTAEKAYSDAATRGAGKLGKAQAGLIKQQATIKQGILAGVGMGGGLLAFSAITGAVKALAGTLGDAVRAAADLELAMRTVNTITKVSDDELRALTRQVQLLAVETGSKTSGLTQAMYSLVSAGVDVENVMDVLTDSVMLAKGALSTTDEAVSLIASTMNAWRMDVSQSSRVMDIWAKTVANGTTTAGKLAGAISNIAPTAAAAGVSLEEVAAALATMTVGGTQTAKATTQLAAAVRGLMVPNTALRKEQEALNGATFAGIMETEGLIGAFSELARVTNGDLSRISAALGPQEALAAYLQLSAEASEITAKNLEDMYGASSKGGVAELMMAERLNTLAGAQERFNATLEVLMQDLGSNFLGPLTTVLQEVSAFLQRDMLAEQALLQRRDNLNLLAGAILNVAEATDAADMAWINSELSEIGKAGGGVDLVSFLTGSNPAGNRVGGDEWTGPRTDQQIVDRFGGLYMEQYGGLTGDQMLKWSAGLGTSLAMIGDLFDEAGISGEKFAEAMDAAVNDGVTLESLGGVTGELDMMESAIGGAADEAEDLNARAIALDASLLTLSRTGMKALREDFKDAQDRFKTFMKNPDAAKNKLEGLQKQREYWVKAQRRAERDNNRFAAVWAEAQITELDKVIPKLEDVAGAIGDVGTEINQLPKKTDLEIEVTQTGGAYISGSLSDRRLRWHGNPIVGSGQGGPGSGGAFAKQKKKTGVKGHASGGNTVGGRTYLVGEEGPELWSDSSRGYMLDAAKTSRALSGSAQGGAVNGRIQHEHSISSESAQALRSAGYDERGVADLLHAAAIDADQRYRFGGR